MICIAAGLPLASHTSCRLRQSERIHTCALMMRTDMLMHFDPAPLIPALTFSNYVQDANRFSLSGHLEI